STVAGIQLALLANLSAFTDIYGLQVGLYNRAKDVYGLQVGLVNVTDNLHGVQIGLINFNHKGPFAMSPILNIGF
ncbi:MAG: LA_2272 family surface repeat-containing protein, partial [Pseudobdellovibrionaceae bacterium]